MAEQDEEHDMYVAQLKQVFESCDSEGISTELSICMACLSCCAFYATLLLNKIVRFRMFQYVHPLS